MGDNPFDVPYGRKTTEYERYLRTEELLDLQKPPERRSHPDELMFQSIHQVEEIWFKLIIHELGEAVVALGEDRFADARCNFERATRVQSLAIRQLRLFETMLPGAYLAIRKGLGQGSGLDSPGFVRIAEVAPEVWTAFDAALQRHDVDLLSLYDDSSDRRDLLHVAEAMVTFDEQMQRFKQEHINVVKRIIGIGTSSLRGNPIDMLERSSRMTFFPMLWAVRDRLFTDFRAGDLDL